MKVNCSICNKEFAIKGIATHNWRKHGNGIDHQKERPELKGKSTWNKGLKKENDKRVAKSAQTQKDKFKNGEIVPSFLGKHHTKETIDKLKLNSGGYREGSGKGKKGRYKGYRCDSLWELAWVISNLDNNVYFERCKLIIKYSYDGQEKRYFPDFIIGNKIIEIKGYLTDKDTYKFKAVKELGYDLEVIRGDKIYPLIKEIEIKYHTSIQNLYDF